MRQGYLIRQPDTPSLYLGNCPDLFRTTHKVKTLALDLLITHDRWGRRSDPSFNGLLHYYPNDLDGSLNEMDTIIIVPLTSSPLYLLLLVRLGVTTVNLFAFYFSTLAFSLSLHRHSYMDVCRR